MPLYVSDSGAEKRGPPIVATLVSGVLGDADLGAFDLDGDGVEELIVATEDGLILTLRDDKIKPYSKSQGLVFDRIVDFDQDGRPDLVLKYFLEQIGTEESDTICRALRRASRGGR